jgi:hydrogenase nickel incorporation protein HypA/HybF
MHELAIAQSMFEIARRHARGQRITRVEVRVGHLRQVVPSALTFAFELVAQGTELEGADLAVEHVPAAGVCRDCGSAIELPDFPLLCSACGGVDIDITAGEELQVDSIEISEERIGPASPATRSSGPADRSAQDFLTGTEA